MRFHRHTIPYTPHKHPAPKHPTAHLALRHRRHVLALVVADRAEDIIKILDAHAPAPRLPRGLERVKQVLVRRVVVQLGRARRGKLP